MVRASSMCVHLYCSPLTQPGRGAQGSPSHAALCGAPRALLPAGLAAAHCARVRRSARRGAAPGSARGAQGPRAAAWGPRRRHGRAEAGGAAGGGAGAGPALGPALRWDCGCSGPGFKCRAALCPLPGSAARPETVVWAAMQDMCYNDWWRKLNQVRRPFWYGQEVVLEAPVRNGERFKIHNNYPQISFCAIWQLCVESTSWLCACRQTDKQTGRSMLSLPFTTLRELCVDPEVARQQFRDGGCPLLVGLCLYELFWLIQWI